jgi:carboxyl-terminal processing protease
MCAWDEASFGKGTVQVPRGLGAYMPYFTQREGCGMIKVTTQKFYRVGGASTQLKGVASDIVLPTVTGGLRIGEGEQDYAMPYDEIPRAGGYVKSSRIARILPELMERSNARVAADKDMQYTREDIARAKERFEKNEISLNKVVREAENAQLLERKKAIDAERKVRYEQMAADDAKNLTIYRLKLGDVNAPKLPLASKADDSEYMDENKDPEDELTETPEYPSNLDPVLREALHIVKDMVEMP